MLPNPMYVVPKGVETRWASPENQKGARGSGAQTNGGRKGSAFYMIPAGEQFVLAEEEGKSGMIRRIWVTVNDRSPQMLRSLRLDFYWDGSAKAAASVPLGDFFGTGLGRTTSFHSALLSSPEGKSFNCCIPMPFRTGMKITITNDGDKDLEMFFYDIDYTIGDRHPEGVLYFHALYRRENPTTRQKDYELLPKVSGSGRFLGVNAGVKANTELYYKSWWGEGECKIYLDGDEEFPTLSGTGTEDYIGTGWGQGQYDHLYQGCHIADGGNMEYCFYRFHLPDPVYFHQDIRIVMQQIGCWDPTSSAQFVEAGRAVHKAGPGRQEVDFQDKSTPEWGCYEREDDWSSCAYFYLNQPFSDLPAIDTVDKRISGLREPRS